eukprot:COSAG05_NODE_280_length_12288_cov_4.797933_12_plen_52_part_00
MHGYKWPIHCTRTPTPDIQTQCHVCARITDYIERARALRNDFQTYKTEIDS